MSLVRCLPGARHAWEVVVGLEVHAQVLSASKFFSRASAAYNLDAMPNTQVALFDAAVPGTLPSVNKRVVEQAVRAGLALRGEVQPLSVFERKHYMYADLPHGYQITQTDMPIIVGGTVAVDVPLRNTKGRKLRDTQRTTVQLDRVQLEIDSGKSHHTLHRDYTLVDLNRAGVALLEIVTTPCIRSADQAGAFLRKLQSVLRHIDVCDGNMEEGSMRCDVNVSVRPFVKDGDTEARPFGPRVEMKNLNSVRHVVNAVEYEAARQIAILEEHGDDAVIESETRSYDAGSGVSVRMRRKEAALDYRFMPEPNLPPLRVLPQEVDAVRDSMPELLDDIQARFMATPSGEGAEGDGTKPRYGLSEYDASVLVAEPGAPEFFETVAEGKDPKLACNWVTSELWGHLRASGIALQDSPVSATALGDLVGLIDDGSISGKIGKDVLELMLGGDDRTAPQIVDDNGWRQITDEAVIDELCRGIVHGGDFDDMVAKACATMPEGDKKAAKAAAKAQKSAFGFLVGQALRASGGMASPSLVSSCMQSVLDEHKRSV